MCRWDEVDVLWGWCSVVLRLSIVLKWLGSDHDNRGFKGRRGWIFTPSSAHATVRMVQTTLRGRVSAEFKNIYSPWSSPPSVTNAGSVGTSPCETQALAISSTCVQVRRNLNCISSLVTQIWSSQYTWKELVRSRRPFTLMWHPS